MRSSGSQDYAQQADPSHGYRVLGHRLGMCQAVGVRAGFDDDDAEREPVNGQRSTVAAQGLGVRRRANRCRSLYCCGMWLVDTRECRQRFMPR